MPVPESLKKKYSLNGDQYPARDADRAIQDLIACITRLHSDNEATGIRATNAESKVAALEKEANELRAANQRLTAEVERFDKKLADLGVSVSANDKKLAEAYDRLAALIARAETLCGDLDDRSTAMCRTIEARTEALCRAAGEHAPVLEAQASVESEAVQPAEEDTPVTDTIESELAEAIPELEEMSDDKLDEDTPDPDMFAEISSQVTKQSGEQTADSSILNALKSALVSAKATDTAASAPETEIGEPKTEAETDSSAEDEIPVADATENESAEAIPELELEEMPDDEIGEDTPDPNLFTDIPSQDTEQASEQTTDSSILNALKNALGSAKAADAATHAPETEISESQTEAKTDSSAEAVSMTDDDIKNMLAAMYSEGGTSEESNAEDTQDKSPAPGSGNEAADEVSESLKTGFGNMKSSLDSIRRRLGK